MDPIPMPAALLSCLLLFPLRGQESRQKQVVMGHRGRSAKEMKTLFKHVILSILSLVLVSCGPKSKSTTTDSHTFSTLAEKKAFLERYVSFRRTYETLTYLIAFRDGGDGGVPSPSEWDVRLIATVPTSEIDSWISGLTVTTAPDTSWLSQVASAPSDLSAFEWHGDSTRLVGIDRARRMVIYRNRTL